MAEAENPRAIAGDNMPPEATEPAAYLQFKEDLDKHIAVSNRWIKERPKIESEEVADTCKGHIDQLRKLMKRADELKADEKRPHLDANKKIEARYKTVVGMLETAVNTLKARLTPYLTELERRQQEEARRQQEEADRLRKEAAEREAAAQAAQASPDAAEDPIGDQIRAQEAEEQAKAAEKAAAKASNEKVGIGRQYGRAMTLVEHWSAIIEDPDRAVWHFRKHPKMLELVQTLATAAVKADHDVKIDGVKAHMEKRAR